MPKDGQGAGHLRYGSDVVVEMLRRLGIEHVAFNPGASFRGIHDSLVNRPDAPEIILVAHENLAVQMAHGYAKASGRPMAAILHDTIGLLNGSLGLFYAHTDRVPVLVLGGSGPQDAARRRPEIDWRHVANVQGDAVREFTKWDDQPASVAAIALSLVRAARIAAAEPAGPVYVALDADLQEAEVATSDAGELLLDPDDYAPASPIGPDPTALAGVVEALVAARSPVIVTGYAGRDEACFELLPRLAESLGAAVVDTGARLSMPNRHRLDLSGAVDMVMPEADLVLLLDTKDAGRTLAETDRERRTTRSRLRADARLVHVGFGDLELPSWVIHHGPLQKAAINVTADTRVALPLLIEGVARAVTAEPTARADEREQRRRTLADEHDARLAGWRSEALAAAGRSPVSTAHLASAVWAAIRDHDWVLTAGDAGGWARRLWDMDRAYRHPGASLGTATQIGISLGVALAHRDAGRLVVDLQPDGDLLYHPGALWTAVAHRLPMLAVMFDNRAYANDLGHQLDMAKVRGTPRENAHIGIALDEPSTDFAALARSFGWWAEGPVTDPAQVEATVRRAADVVVRERRPALVDVICDFR